MARKAKRRYSRGAGSDVKNEMHRYKRGTAKSGPGGKGGKVKSRKQAIAIGLSQAKKAGAKVPPKAHGTGSASNWIPGRHPNRASMAPRWPRWPCLRKTADGRKRRD